MIKNIFFSLYKRFIGCFSGYRLEEISFIKNINSFFISILKPDFIEIDGNKMFLDKEDCLRISVHGSYENLQTELIKREIKSDDTVLDIGANIGYYTLIAAKLVGKGGRVFSFEPDPENFLVLKNNVDLNRYKNVTLVKKAVYDVTGKNKLYLSKDAKLYSMSQQTSDKFIDIETISLDDYFSNLDNKIDLIKIDIEGSEAKALKGMNNLLIKNKKIKLITEFNPILLYKSGSSPENFLKDILRYGFKIYDINTFENRIAEADYENLLKTYKTQDAGFTNLFCVKQ